MEASFDSVAGYYEVLSDSEARLKREGPLLLDVLLRAPGHRVVDLACGTGLHAEFLARHGAQVAAFDLSPEMIAHAQQRRPHPAVHYATGDMRDVDGGPWDLALCLGNSLSLLPSEDDLIRTFRSVARGLSPGGLFLIQVLNYALPAAQQPRHRVETRARDGAEIIAVKNLIPHGDRTLLALTFFARQGSEYATASDAAVLFHLTREHIETLAAQTGFRIEEIRGGFDHTPYDPLASTDLLCLLVRV